MKVYLALGYFCDSYDSDPDILGIFAKQEDAEIAMAAWISEKEKLGRSVFAQSDEMTVQ